MAYENESSIQPIEPIITLIDGYQHKDPRLFDILTALAHTVQDISNVISPKQKALRTLPASDQAAEHISFVDYEILSQRYLRIFWTPANNVVWYEIRKGNTWETASVVTVTTQTEVRLDPIPTGSTRFHVRGRNSLGILGTGVSVLVIIGGVGSSTITNQVIDNNVLLKWSEPTSPWEINYYEVYKGTQSIGYIDSTFFVIFETVAGSFTYSIVAVDIAGNKGPVNSITATVNQPPDFELQDVRVSLLSGARTNALIYGDLGLGWEQTVDANGWVIDDVDGWIASYTGKLILPVDTTQTYQEHFDDNLWLSPQQQVTAGYPIYIQPTNLTASYVETIDYGAIFNNIILTLSWTLEQLSLAGTVAAASTIEFSDDGIAWTAPVSGPSAFAVSFRYARFNFSFTGNNDKALAVFSSLMVLLNVKREVDSGIVSALASDADGTEVFFNKSFKDVDSITLAATGEVEPLNMLYDFLDVPYPVSFKVFVFDSTGNRTNALVSWKARGIV
jgi:hypothetical protein